MNWYRQARIESELPSIAAQFRGEMVAKFGDETLKNKCLQTSKLLKRNLEGRGFANAIVVKGLFTVDLIDESINKLNTDNFMGNKAMTDAALFQMSHYWVEVGTTLIDITASQFNDLLDVEVPDIVMGPRNAMKRYITITEDWI